MVRAYDTGETRLPTAPPGELERQAALTERLLTARPARWEVPGPDPAAWSDAVGEALGAPVALESYGPTAADKREVQRRIPARRAAVSQEGNSDRSRS